MAFYSPKKIIKNIIGTILILVGIVGLFLPVIQGVLLIFLGVTVLEFNKKEYLLSKLKQNRYFKKLRSRLPKR